MAPLVLINVVGLTGRLLPQAARLHALAQSGWICSLQEPIPAVTCTAQATLLTGVTVNHHGIVGNGWFWRDTGEVRFWQQSNRLLESEPVYVTAGRRARQLGNEFRSAQLFWWFNQGAQVDIFVTPKPYYGADGNKVFGILGSPNGLTKSLEKKLGRFPFHTFWGPSAGLSSTQWIARCAAEVVDRYRPDLTLVYLPHLDYDTQRFGPQGCSMARLVGELDDACAPLLEMARARGALVWIVSEYGYAQVSRPVLLNRVLRREGMLAVRPGPFGEQLDTFASKAFAVCDHQLAHIYVNDNDEVGKVYEILAPVPGVARLLRGEERAELNLDHERAGDLIALAQADSWFAYPFWLDDRVAPDYARTVDIHRKPGYDPCELFFDPKLYWPKGKALVRLIQKWMGFRTLFDVIPLEPGLIRGSHGLSATEGLDRPILIGDGPAPPSSEIPMTGVRDLLLQALGLA